MNKEIYVYVDIDDTIVRSAGSKRIPIPNVIKHVRQLKESGAVMYCWSSGGAEYAKQSAQEFGVEDCFTAFLPKPNILIDDQELHTWKRFSQVHPSGCSHETLDSYLERLDT